MFAADRQEGESPGPPAPDDAQQPDAQQPVALPPEELPPEEIIPLEHRADPEDPPQDQPHPPLDEQAHPEEEFPPRDITIIHLENPILPGEHAGEEHAEGIFSSDYLKLWLGLFCFMMNISIFNLLPYYLEMRGASPGFYGLAAGIGGLCSVLVMIFLARHADAWTRKTTVTLYLLPALAGNLLSLWALWQPSLNWYLLVRVLQGLFMGIGFPLVFSWAVELAPPGRRVVVLAWLGIAGILSNSLGPTLAELLLAGSSDPGAPESFGPVFALATIFSGISLLCFLFTSDTQPPREQDKSRSGILFMLRRPSTLLLMFVSGSFGGLFGVLMSFGKNYVSFLGLDYVSILIWAYSGGAIFSRVIIQFILRVVPKGHLVPAGLLGLGLSFFILGLGGDYLLLVITGVIYGLSHGILYPTLFSGFLDMQRPSEAGRAAILHQGAFSTGFGILTMVGGSIISVAGFSVFFSMLGALAGACIFVYILAERVAGPGPRGRS
ncbi:MAG: MFS transporter [Deltaproteobacteria bacterium]|nr:MFS transporter [Deltaproteobacteria bacterium]